MNKLVKFLLRIVLFVVLTFIFVVIFEHGIVAAPSKAVSEFFTLKQEVEAGVSKFR